MWPARILHRGWGATTGRDRNRFSWFPLRRRWKPTKAMTYFRYPGSPYIESCKISYIKGTRQSSYAKGTMGCNSTRREPAGLSISLKRHGPLYIGVQSFSDIFGAITYFRSPGSAYIENGTIENITFWSETCPAKLLCNCLLYTSPSPRD